MVMHHEDGEGMQKMHAEHAVTLREAAAALKDSRPDLAAKLEAMVKMHESMHGSMEEGETEAGHPHEHGSHAH